MLAFDTSSLPSDPVNEPVLDQRCEESPPADEPALDRRHEELPPIDEPVLDRHAALPSIDERLVAPGGRYEIFDGVLVPAWPFNEPGLGRPSAPPRVDERLLAPGVQHEVFDGVLVDVPPADELDTFRHEKLGALLESHVAAELQIAINMLTRTSETSDFATDVSVYPRAPDPHTDGRQLEQLAFEVCDSESLSHTARKAGKLAERGVRRVFAIDVERQRVLEWSREQVLWRFLDRDVEIDDPALASPLRVRALLEVAKIDDEAARALLIKDDEAREAATAQRDAGAREAGFVHGKATGRAEGIITLLVARGVTLDPTTRERILAEPDLARLDRWVVRAASCGSISELLAEL
jgi:hypothetical protein